MARSAWAVLAVLLLACSTSASWSRSWADAIERKLVNSVLGRYQDHAISSGELPEGSQPALIFFKFVVPPTKSEDFIAKWNQYIGKPAHEAQGNIQVHLNLPIVTNAIYTDYSEWQSYADFIKFAKGHESTSFVKYVEENDIRWDFESFVNATGSQERGKGLAAWAGKDAWEVLTTVTLKPSLTKEWLSVWRDVAKTTQEENGNLVYSLRRTIENNYKFYVYGMWESEDAWKEHVKSSHIRKLAQWAIKHDVIYFESPLLNLDQY